MKTFLSFLTVCLLGSTLTWAVPASKKTVEATPVPTPGATATPTPKPSPWKKQVVSKFNLNQAHFDNWAQGGNDTIAWQAGLYALFERDGAKGDWKNTLRVEYGRTKSSDQVSLKTSDDLFLETVYTLKVRKWVNPYVSANVETQMDKGFDTQVTPQAQTSQFLDPGYFTQAVGLAYDGKNGFTSRLGAAVKETLTSRFNGYADNPKTAAVEKTRVEPGVNSVTEYKLKVGSHSLFDTQLEVFSNMKAMNQIYTRWGNRLTVKATKYLEMSAEFELLYDGHVSKARQIRQGLGLGLAYNLL